MRICLVVDAEMLVRVTRTMVTIATNIRVSMRDIPRSFEGDDFGGVFCFFYSHDEPQLTTVPLTLQLFFCIALAMPFVDTFRHVQFEPEYIGIIGPGVVKAPGKKVTSVPSGKSVANFAFSIILEIGGTMSLAGNKLNRCLRENSHKPVATCTHSHLFLSF